jgi:hypothetical protein
LAYLYSEIGDANNDLKGTLKKLIQFSEEVKAANDTDTIKEQGWGRKLKGLIQSLANGSESLKKINEGEEALLSIYHKLEHLASLFNMNEIMTLIHKFI